MMATLPIETTVLGPAYSIKIEHGSFSKTMQPNSSSCHQRQCGARLTFAFSRCPPERNPQCSSGEPRPIFSARPRTRLLPGHVAVYFGGQIELYYPTRANWRSRSMPVSGPNRWSVSVMQTWHRCEAGKNPASWDLPAGTRAVYGSSDFSSHRPRLIPSCSH